MYSSDFLKLNPELVTLQDKKGNKYHAVRTQYNGECFDSKREAEYFLELCCRRRTGELTFLMQVPFPLINGTVKYLADFLVFFTDGRAEIHEVKGCPTATWKIKKKLMAAEYPGIKLVEVK